MNITNSMIESFKMGFHGSTLNDDQVRRGLSAVFTMIGLYDPTAPMADGGEEPMSAAEEVLSWLLVEKAGVPDDVGYSPDQAQAIIAARLDDPEPQEVKVTEIEWKEFEDGTVRSVNSILYYRLQKHDDGFWRNSAGGQISSIGEHPTLDAIMMAAQADYASLVRSALAQHASSTRADKPNRGWKLVPMHPTKTMIDAAVEGAVPVSYSEASHCYHAMLAAAPHIDGGPPARRWDDQLKCYVHI